MMRTASSAKPGVYDFHFFFQVIDPVVAMATALQGQVRPRCFFDIEIGGEGGMIKL